MRHISILSVLFLFCGCAAMNSINNKEKLNDNNTVIAVDAKQRFIISKNILKNDNGTVTDTNQVGICVEPSPDVFAAISSALEGSFNKSESISAIFKAAMSESAGTIGIRTEAIQLLRDAMFRLCEGYINGSISSQSYEQLHERYQKSMVTLAAVGALADSARPIQLALGGQATITRSELVKMLIEDKNKAETTLKTTEAESEKANGEFEVSLKAVCGDADTNCNVEGDVKNREEAALKYCEGQGNNGDCETLLTKKANRDQALSVKTNAEEDLKRIKDDLEHAKTNDNLMVTSSVSWSPNSATQPSTKNIEEVAGVVEELVKQVYQDSWFERCLSFQEERKIQSTKLEEKKEKVAKLQDENKKLAITRDELVSANNNLSQIPDDTEALRTVGLTKSQIRNNRAILERVQQKIQEDIERNQNQINKAKSEEKNLNDSKNKLEKSMEDMNCGLFVELN